MFQGKRRFLVLSGIMILAFTVPVAAYGVASRGGGDDANVRINQGLSAPSGSEQVGALADGVADDNEYREAAARTVACLRAAGINVIEDSSDPTQFRYGGGTMEEQQEANVAYARCYATHQQEIDMQRAASASSALAPDETEAASSAMVSCLRDSGLELAPDATSTEWRHWQYDAPLEFAQCAEAVIAEFGSLP